MTKQQTAPAPQQAPQLSETEKKLLKQIQGCAKEVHSVVMKYGTSAAFGFAGW